MRKTPERRPGQGAASDTHVVIQNSNSGKIDDVSTGPQPSAFASFCIEAGGFVKCTIVRRSDPLILLAALAARDAAAIPVTSVAVATGAAPGSGYKSGWVADKRREKLWDWSPLGPAAPREPSAEVLTWARSGAIAYAKAMGARR